MGARVEPGPLLSESSGRGIGPDTRHGPAGMREMGAAGFHVSLSDFLPHCLPRSPFPPPSPSLLSHSHAQLRSAARGRSPGQTSAGEGEAGPGPGRNRRPLVVRRGAMWGTCRTCVRDHGSRLARFAASEASTSGTVCGMPAVDGSLRPSIHQSPSPRQCHPMRTVPSAHCGYDRIYQDILFG